MRKLSLAIVIVLAALAIFAALAPWKTWLEAEMKRFLAAQGMTDIAFAVDSLSTEGIVIRDVSLGGAWPFTLDRLTVAFSLRELLERRLRTVEAGELVVRSGGMEIHAREAKLLFEPDELFWKGTWEVASVDIRNAPLPLPALAGKGSFQASQTAVSVDGGFSSDDKSYDASFILTYLSGKPKESQLVITHARMPWNGGVVSVGKTTYPLVEKKPVHATLMVKKVELGSLLREATGSRASATGVVSGTIPLVIDEKGEVQFRSGNLKAEQAGTIALAPDTIPGDNEQVALVRDVLADFRYDQLSLDLSSGKDDKLSMLLQLSGNNPAVYNGRQVKLNVRLTGDVLNLIQQSVMQMTDPKQLLKQGEP